MTERERFEQWLVNANLDAATDDWKRHESSTSLAEALMWIAWQARAELAEAELARIAQAHRSNGK